MRLTTPIFRVFGSLQVGAFLQPVDMPGVAVDRDRELTSGGVGGVIAW